MDKTRAKIKSTSMTAFVAILAIALLFGIQTSINIFDWLTTGEALSNPDSVRHAWDCSGTGFSSRWPCTSLSSFCASIARRRRSSQTCRARSKRWPCSFSRRSRCRSGCTGQSSASKPERCPASRGRIGHVRLHAGRHRVLPRADHRVRLSRPRRELRDHLGGRHGYRAALDRMMADRKVSLGELAEKVGIATATCRS